MLELRVLGELQIVRDGRVVTLPPSKKTRALLSYLVLTARTHRRERLCSLLWDVADDPRGALRWSLSRIRALIDDDTPRVFADRDGARIELRGAFLDLEAARTLADAADTAELDALLTATGWFRGELLEGLDLDEFDEYQAWCVAEREAARRIRRTLCEALVTRLGETDAVRALAPARTLVHLDPADEGARARLVRLLAASGRLAEARQQLDAGKRALGERGARVGGPLREAEAALRAGGAPPAAAAPEPPPPLPMIARSPVALSAVHGLRLVGREVELARIGAALDACATRHRLHVLSLVGEPGVGKSRLLVESIIATRRRRGVSLEGCAFEAERGRPYGPLLDALRRLPRDGASVSLEALLSGGADGGGPTSRERLFDAITALVTTRAREAPPLLLLLDDVQWLDESSVELLHHLVRSCREEPILVLLAARAGEVADNAPLLRVLRGLRRDRLLDEVVVPRLDAERTGRLARLVAPGIDIEAVYRESGGNPLFALEVARAGEVHEVAPSLSGIVRDRVERLPDEAADVLRWATMLGTTFRVRLLAEVVGLPATELVAVLDRLERHALIGGVVDLEDPGNTYQFAHELVHRVIHGDLSAPRKRLMHLEVARALERLHGGDDAVAAEVAHHAIRAGEPALAARACATAAARCLRLFAPSQALSLLQRGLSQAERLGEPARSEHVGILAGLAKEAERAAEARAPA